MPIVSGLLHSKEQYLQSSRHFLLSTCYTFHLAFKAQHKRLLIPLGRIHFPDFCPARSLVTDLLHDLSWSGYNQLGVYLSCQIVSPRGRGCAHLICMLLPDSGGDSQLGQLSASPDMCPLARPTWLPPLLKGEDSSLKAPVPQGLLIPRPPWPTSLPLREATCDPDCYSLFYWFSLYIPDNVNHSIYLEIHFSLCVTISPCFFLPLSFLSLFF